MGLRLIVHRVQAPGRSEPEHSVLILTAPERFLVEGLVGVCRVSHHIKNGKRCTAEVPIQACFELTSYFLASVKQI